MSVLRIPPGLGPAVGFNTQVPGTNKAQGSTSVPVPVRLTLPFSSVAVAVRLGPVLAGPASNLCVGVAGRSAAVCCVRVGGRGAERLRLTHTRFCDTDIPVQKTATATATHTINIMSG